MTDSRDIDEILASLDALLREGDSHNDDMPAKAVGSTPHHDVSKVDLESDIKVVEASTEAFLASDELEDESFTVEAVSDETETWQEDGMSRVVLTEDMMVENPQVSLPLAFNAEALHEDDVQESESPVSEEPKANDTMQDVEQQGEQVVNDAVTDAITDDVASSDVTPNDVTSNHVIHLQKQDIEQLLMLVTEDVSSHLQQMLPKLMKESLHTHLADMQHESDKNNKTSDDE